MFFRTGRLQFWRNCRKFLVKVKNSSVQFLKIFKDSSFLPEKIFLKTFLLTHGMLSRQAFRLLLAKTPENVLLKL